MNVNKVFYGTVLEQISNIDTGSINCVVTSPPYYGLRDYGVDGQIGLEKTPEEYIEKLVSVFREVKRVLKKDGTLWLNIGDSYMSAGGSSRHFGYADPKYPNGRNGSHAEPTAYKHPTIKPKDLILIPFMLASALRADGWYLRQDIIWYKPNCMPESVRDRCTKSHEYIFLLTKSKKYYFDHEEMLEIATGYDGRKSTKMKGSKKYNSAEIMPDAKPQSFSARPHERWRFKKLYDKEQSTHTIHENEIDGENKLYPVRNKRSVWKVNTKPYHGAHFATFPPELITPCILAGCPEGGIVLDPFIGSGTVAEVALKNKRNFLGIELNQDYEKLIDERLNFSKQENFVFKGVAHE